MAEYIIYGFGSDEQHMLGYFLCRNVESCTPEFEKVSFIGKANKPYTIFFDGELLDYILIIPEEDVDEPYIPRSEDGDSISDSSASTDSDGTLPL